MWVLTLVVGVVVVLVITAATAYFVAQEFAFMTVDRARLAARASAGDIGAERALSITRRTSFMLSGAQLGITVTGLLVGYVAEPLIGESIAIGLGVAVPEGTGLVLGTVIALAFSTVVQMLVGELVPKNLAIARPEPTAVWLSRSTKVYLAVFGWAISFFDGASNRLLRLVRIEPVHDVEHAATASDLEHIVADSASSGALPKELSVLIERIIDFPNHDVEHAMVPTSRVDVVSVRASIGEVRRRMASGHTRYPVVDDRRDVVGVVEMSQVLAWPSAEDDAPVDQVMGPPILLPTSMGLPEALEQMVSSGAEMACVLDEYGGLAGIVTVEDLAEEIVGELADEHDPETQVEQAVEEADSVWRMAGDLHLDEVERILGLELPDGDFETLAGLVIDAAGQLPDVGDLVEVVLPIDPAELAGPGEPVRRILSAEILSLERHVPAWLRLELLTDATAAESDTREPKAGDHAV